MRYRINDQAGLVAKFGVSGGEKLVHFGGPDWARAPLIDGGHPPH